MLESEANTPALLSALTQRDRIAAALTAEITTPSVVQHLAKLDCRLRQVSTQVPDADWGTWRQTLGAPSSYWWWWLDEAQNQVREKNSLPWIILAGTLMTVTLGLAIDIIQRLWSGGPDSLLIISAIFTLAITGSPLTKQGRELASWIMDKVRLPFLYRGKTMLGAACLAFTLVLILRLALPGVATVYNNRGYTLLRSGDLTGAQQAFARAININQEYAAGYYNLADAYLGIADYDKAVSLYTQALVADRTLDLAYGGLGYVYILQGKPERAIPILYEGLGHAQTDTVRSILLTNLGRAYLESQQFHEAEETLGEALRLTPTEAAARCVLGLIREALKYPDDQVASDWENCLRYADATTPRGQELATEARAHLLSLKGGRP